MQRAVRQIWNIIIMTTNSGRLCWITHLSIGMIKSTSLLFCFICNRLFHKRKHYFTPADIHKPGLRSNQWRSVKPEKCQVRFIQTITQVLVIVGSISRLTSFLKLYEVECPDVRSPPEKQHQRALAWLRSTQAYIPVLFNRLLVTTFSFQAAKDVFWNNSSQ